MVAEACLLGGESAGRQGCFCTTFGFARLASVFLRCCISWSFANWYVEMGLKMYSGFYFASWLVCELSIFGGFSKLRLMTYEIGNENV